MRTLRVHPINEKQEKALIAVFEALEVEYEEDVNETDETERILANDFLTAKLTQSRKDMLDGKWEKIPVEVLW